MTAQKSRSSLKNAYHQHNYRRQGITLCKQLISLTIEIQKHRGCTLAILSGDHFFQTQLYNIQRDITDHFQQLEDLRREFGKELLELDDTMHIMQEWIGIRRLWNQDTAEENFLLHSNLISGLLTLIWRVAQHSNQLGLSPTQDNLVTFSFNDWLKMIETAAQARGLATHCAVQKNNANEIRSRVRFLHQQMINADQHFQTTLTSFESTQTAKINRAAERAEYALHLKNFLSALSMNFFNTEAPNLSADQIYTLGSHVVSACQQILLASLKYVERTLSPELKSWISGETIGETATENNKNVDQNLELFAEKQPL